MRRRLRDLPIRGKLAFIDLATTAAALLLACGAFVAYEQVSSRRSMVRDLSTTAEMIAFNTTSALTFDDAASAEQTLKALATQPHVMAACIYNADGAVFAGYRRAGETETEWPAAQGGGETFDGASLRLFRRMRLDGDEVGTIFLQSDLEEAAARRRRYALIAAATIAVAVVMAFILGRVLHRLITVPVRRLADAIAGVSAGRSRGSVRAVKMGNDELGELTDGFNAMIAQIEARENDLRRAHAELESRVEERTRELSIEIRERQRMEEERDRFFTLSVDLFCIAGFDGTLRRVNPAFENLGFSAADLHDMGFLDLVDPADRSAVEAALATLTEGNLLRNYQVRMRCVSGASRWFAWSIKAAPDHQLFYACGRDISEQKRAEAERETLHRQLVDISRQAGMAEVATSVLHNVGNVLNSVNVSATLVESDVRKARVVLVRQVATLLTEHEADLPGFFAQDPQARRLPHLLDVLAGHLEQVQGEVTEELRSLRKNVEHIKQIVAQQQDYARVGGVAEPTEIAEVIEDALRMNAGSLARHGIALKREYQSHPRITVEKHKVLQILVNLIRNAEHACIEAAQPDRAVTVRIVPAADDVRIEVTDNGVGIAPENMTRIFQHGFTTRRYGHGFGLHGGALTAQELGGALRVHSDGPGRGATFTLVLPATPPGREGCAGTIGSEAPLQTRLTGTVRPTGCTER